MKYIYSTNEIHTCDRYKKNVHATDTWNTYNKCLQDVLANSIEKHTYKIYIQHVLTRHKKWHQQDILAKHIKNWLQYIFTLSARYTCKTYKKLHHNTPCNCQQDIHVRHIKNCTEIHPYTFSKTYLQDI